MELFSNKLEGEREDLQRVQDLVPLRDLSLNRNVCGLRRCLRVGYGDEEHPFLDEILLDVWDVNRSKY
jgi:hypothetical protein